MCGTQNAQSANACKFCGYIFEDFKTAGLSSTDGNIAPPASKVSVDENLNTVPTNSNVENFPDISTSSTSPVSSINTGAAVFVVSKSLLTSILPSLAYLVFVLLVTLSSGLNLYTLGIFVFFIAVAVLPQLFTPRRFEFYDDRVRVHKIIGGDSEIPYSDLTYSFFSRGKRSQIVLSSLTRRRQQLAIPSNPINKDLGMDLNKFLETKMKKPEAKTSGKNTSSDRSAGSTAANPDSDSESNQKSVF
ncbi:MAG: hypothetical protein OK457_04235 [Thaumarchaeota archaeon]|nr:hypothetical protein [Nitrososphaerota archaeon]